MAKRGKKTETFEGNLERLEQLAGELEGGELKLEEAIRRYEEGVGLYGKCHEILKNAEKKVQMLTRDAQGKLKAVPLDRSDSRTESPAEPDDEAAGEHENADSKESGTELF